MFLLFVENVESWLRHLNPLASFLVILWVVTIIVFKDVMSYKIKNFNFKKINIFKFKKEVKNISLLKDHDIFNVIERVRLDIKFKKFYTSGEIDIIKTKMFVDFMNFYLDAIRENYKKFLKDENHATKTHDELKASIFILMNTTEENCANKTKAHFMKKGLTNENSEYVIELFSTWRNETSKAVVARVDGIFSSTFHYDSFGKLLGCLEVISMSIDLIPKDGIESFEKMNGKFKNLIY